ncbi:MAG: ribosomal protein L7/L12, partial [Myxococcota bacterium]
TGISASEQRSMQVALGYALQHLATWPDELRAPPPAWRTAARAGQPPPAWPLTRPYAVRLERIGGRKIQVIKDLRNVLGVGLKDAKELADRAPGLVAQFIGFQQASYLVKALNNAGAMAVLIKPPEMHHVQPQLLLSGLRSPGNRYTAIRILEEQGGCTAADARHIIDRIMEGSPQQVGANLTPAERDTLRTRLEELSVQVETVDIPQLTSELIAPPLPSYPPQTLVLTGYDRRQKIRAIKAIRTVTALGLKEAKDLSEGGFPVTIKLTLRNLSWDDARQVLRDGGVIFEDPSGH